LINPSFHVFTHLIDRHDCDVWLLNWGRIWLLERQWDVNALLITTQLDWAPVKNFDSFSFIMIEQSTLGVLTSSK